MLYADSTDSGTDYPLAVGYKLDANVHMVPLSVVMGDITYQDGSEAVRNNFFKVLESSNDLPTTSQPSAGDFAKIIPKPGRQRPGYPFHPSLLRAERNDQLCHRCNQNGARSEYNRCGYQKRFPSARVGRWQQQPKQSAQAGQERKFWNCSRK